MTVIRMTSNNRRLEGTRAANGQHATTRRDAATGQIEQQAAELRRQWQADPRW